MNNDILERYKQAQKFLLGNALNTMAKNDYVVANWILDSHCFWYEKATQNGKEYRLVDPKTASNEQAFDIKALANALSTVIDKPVDQPSLSEVTIILEPPQVQFKALNKYWQFNPETAELINIEKTGKSQCSAFGDNPEFIPYFLPEDQQSLPSPDGRKAAFIREHNVWIRDLATGDEQQLTEDGVADYSFASNRCLGIDSAVQAKWSPDSKQLLTVRRDTRECGSRASINYVPEDGSILPQLSQFNQPYSGDEHVDTYQLTVIDVATKQLKVADYPNLPLVRCGLFVSGFFRAKLGWWSPDSRYVFFVDITRGAKSVRVVKWDTQTETIKVLFEETTDTSVKLSHQVTEPIQILPLPETEELIWFSQRSGWAHLYLYDLNSSELKHQITGIDTSMNGGEWHIREILHFDAKRRELLVQTSARDTSINPYYCDICKINIDSRELTPLASGPFEYNVYQHSRDVVIAGLMMGDFSNDANAVSPCGQYILITRSKVDTIPVTVLIDRDGQEILEIETADTSDLPVDWQWPESVKLKSADGQTDIYGVVFRPPGFSPDNSYPVVEYATAARNYSGVPQGSFHNSNQGGFVYFFGSALAALGFIVVAIDGRGVPLRDKAFHDHHYGNFYYTNDFTDRIAGIKQLAQRYPYMDIERMGITSPECPVNTVYALLKHSDFYKVAVQHCLTDPRFGVFMHETYDGTIDSSVRNNNCYPENYVKSFDGKLLLIVGMKSSIATSSSFRLVDALQKANKNFDMLCIPNLHHEISGYVIRREWDFLVKHLQDIAPPRNFQLKAGYEIMVEAVDNDIYDLADFD